MGEETIKAAVWYNGKTVNQDGNNPRYVGGIVKFIDVDPNTKVEVFLCTVRDIFGIPEAVPIAMKYHIFFSTEISKLLDVTPYESLKSMLQPGLMLHPFYVEENVVEDVTDTTSNMPSSVKPSARIHVDGSLNHAQNSFQAPVLNPIPARQPNKPSTRDRDERVRSVKVGDGVGGTSSTNSSQMRIFIKSLCGLVKTLDVERTETVGSLKERIRKTEGTAAKDQRLIYSGKQLEDDRTLAAYGIADGCTIAIVQCLRGC